LVIFVPERTISPRVRDFVAVLGAPVVILAWLVPGLLPTFVSGVPQAGEVRCRAWKAVVVPMLCFIELVPLVAEQGIWRVPTEKICTGSALATEVDGMHQGVADRHVVGAAWQQGLCIPRGYVTKPVEYAGVEVDVVDAG
jgi:hypothetical protein